MDQIQGTVLSTRYRAPDSGFTVIVAEVDGFEASVVGVRDSAVENGIEFIAKGKWETNGKFGPQFKFDVLTVRAPTTREGVIARLKTYPGIGPATAEAIVERFGDETWTVLDQSPDELAVIRGLGPKSLEKIKAHHALQHGPVAQLHARLIELFVGARIKSVSSARTIASSIRAAFEDQAMDTLEGHPYKIAARVEGFGFMTAERLARSLGLDPRSDERVEAGVVHAIREAQAQGHCAVPPAELSSSAVEILRVDTDVVDAALKRLVGAGVLRFRPGDGDHASLVYTWQMDSSEDTVAKAITVLARADHSQWDASGLPEALSDGQVRAVEAVARCGVTVLTGGPGTGKSTVLANVITVAQREGVHVILCAPTGRAAKRMSEVTGREASTIHRLLGLTPGGGFERCREYPLEPGLIVIDEASMIDLYLAAALFSALTPQHRVLIVGDADQLPSVGSGNVLADLIAAAEQVEEMGLVRLTEVFRQAEGSPIVANAHRILKGEDLQPDPHTKGAAGEFFVIAASSLESAHAKIVDMATTRIPSAYGLDRMTEVQVICPMRRDALEINAELQRHYTAGQPEFGFRDRKFHLGDRVMQTKNDYGRNVFNGDIGTVVDVDAVDPDIEGPAMVVDFDGHRAAYGRGDLGPLRLAYAMTIHKSQGSEFPAVLIPITMMHRRMLRKNLLYTAVTRARLLCVLVGDPRAIRLAIDTADASKRWTGLARRIVKALVRE